MGDRLADDDDSLDPNVQGGLWEHQGHPLTLRDLQLALRDLPDDLAIEVERLDGLGGRDRYIASSLDLRGHDRVAEALVFVIV
jgi:hypothetical protein